MVKKILFFSVCILLGLFASAQRIYVWCPPETGLSSPNDKLKGLNINVVISDTRTIIDTTKVECNSQNLIDIIANTVVSTYPSAIINILDSSQYKQAGEENKITIKIAISAYHSASGTDVSTAIGNPEGNFNWGILPKNKWNSVAGFHVVIDDYRTDEHKTLTRNIANIVSRPNIGGSLTAKKALYEAYREANKELLYFIETTIK
ncbi:MAG TPA: hypothetical protein VN040_15950 [Pseudosphingobacterium sp.]|nr:hypothetical protein [Pseudosphingobacterium sp.]